MGHSRGRIVVHGDGFNDASNGFGAEGGDTNRHHRSAFPEVLAQRVVERANFGLADHRCLLSVGGPRAGNRLSAAIAEKSVGQGTADEGRLNFQKMARRLNHCGV